MLGYYDLYNRWLATGDVHKLEYEIIEDDYRIETGALIRTTIIGRGYKANPDGLIIDHHGTLRNSNSNSNKVIARNVIDTFRNIYATADNCFYKRNRNLCYFNRETTPFHRSFISGRSVWI